MSLPDMASAFQGLRNHFRANARKIVVQVSEGGFVTLHPFERPTRGCYWLGSQDVYVRVGDRLLLARARMDISVRGSEGWPHCLPELPPEVPADGRLEETFRLAGTLLDDTERAGADLADAARRLGDTGAGPEPARTGRGVEAARWRLVAIVAPAVLLLALAALAVAAGWPVASVLFVFVSLLWVLVTI